MKYKKNFIFLVILIIFGFKCHSQKRSSYNLDLKTKYGTKVGIKLSIQHGSDYNFDKHNPLIKEINSKIIDSLDFYDAIEMYTTVIDKMGLVAEHIYKEKFAENDIKFYKLYLLQVEIPYEMKVLYNRQSDITQKYLETILVIKSKKDSLNNILQSKRINKKIKKQAKRELETLEKADYFEKIYNGQVFDLINKSEIN